VLGQEMLEIDLRTGAASSIWPETIFQVQSQNTSTPDIAANPSGFFPRFPLSINYAPNVDRLIFDGVVSPIDGNAASLAFFVAAVAMPVGAGVAALETRFAYGLNLLTAAGSFAVAMSFTEPARAARDQALDSARAFRRQLAECAGDLRDPTTAWIFYYAVFMTVLNHIPYEFYQSRIESWTGPGSSWAPLISGLILSAGQLAAAAASRVSIRVSRRFGDRPALLSTLALQTAVIGAMGALVHPIVAAVIVLRSVPDAVGAPILLARVAEKVPSLRRATFLSLQSLAGRLAYSLWLLAMSVVVGGPPAGDEIPALLFLGAGLGVAGGLAFAFLSRRLR